jgi:hypothetical protein
MRMDKLTSRFQQALADAQSLAVGGDHRRAGVVAARLQREDHAGARAGTVRHMIRASSRLSW